MQNKNLWKLLLAAFVICLPFAFTSCSSDDDDDAGPRSYTYSWIFNYTLSKNASSADKIAAAQAEATISTIFFNELLQLGFTSGTAEQSVTVETENVEDWDNLAISALYKTKSNEYVKEAITVLPSDTKIVLKRNNKQIEQLSL